MATYNTVFLLFCWISFAVAWSPRLLSPRSDNTKTSLPNEYSYETFYLDQQVDHFGFNNGDTFKQRYLIASQFWNHHGGPIFFYTGNEGDITWFCNNTGFMWDIAPEFRALLVFAEHRYYGSSIPYGSQAFKDPSKLNYLTSEQALADFAVLIRYLKSSIPGTNDSPVVAFGGSYGGMLSAWMRMKYPSAVIGALAASAPIWDFTGLTKCSALMDTVTKSFMKASPPCVDNIRQSWTTIDKIAATADGRNFIYNTFHLCAPLKTADDVGNFKAWLANAWFDLAMVNYPYPANFLEPLPAWPVKAVCAPLGSPLEDKLLMQGLYKAVNIYFNYTGQAKCLNTSQDATASLGDAGWGYQACTEMVMPDCADSSSMFEPTTWNFTSFSNSCFSSYKIRPRQDWVATQYGGKDIEAPTNIIFSNGLLDPWSAGGVLNSLSDTLIAIQIPDGAHHLDLRAANKDDTAYVKAARTQEKNIIRLWLSSQ
ncbi:lysosomal Pro-X carboxypeptidase-like [Haliotis cracherodii]|uniref:lysosomal Pro-X carboxypeptidase-like n=1 Tax=Haliotis cracherodii TaxID=6455 RepID=UPI0039E7610F